MNPVIFLDIDGVINPYSSGTRKIEILDGIARKMADEKNWPGIALLGDKMVSQFLSSFDKDSLHLLKKLQEEFDARIVITSSWRVYYTFETLQSIFRLFDIEIHGLLPMGFPRSDIIRAYAASHHLTRWIAIDDMDMEKPLGHHYIRTDSSFSRQDYEKARRRLSL